jgi:integrase
MDGGGLLLRVAEGGGKKWLFRYASPATGKRREMGLGRADEGYVSLKDAREAAQAARDLLAKKIDPIDEAEREKQARLAETKKAAPKTFGQFADEWLDQKENEFSNPKHRAQWRMTLREYAGSLRDKAPGSITTEDVLAVLQPIWLSKPETAKRTQGRIENVMDAARAKGLYAGSNPARWRGHLDKVLPSRSKRSKGHHAALPYKDLPAFMIELRTRTGIAARALEFLILAAARSGEVRGMTWAEIDTEARRWTVPGHRMKAGKAHRVPLTDRALEILTEIARLRPAGDNGAALVFPGDENSGRRKPGSVGPVQMSDMTLAAVLKRMQRTDITVHGFRSCFRDWAEDVARYPYGAIKAALAHTISDGTDAAYRRGDGYEIRAELMGVWETYLNSGGGTDNVVPMRRA